MNITDEQQKIITTTANKVVVIASAASGKTTVLVERVRYLLNQGINPKDIVLITFTNAAAEELSIRLNKPKGLFIGTIHAYANYLLLSSGYDTKRILDNERFDELFYKIKDWPQAIQPVKYLLLDESQDSNKIHFEFLLDMIQPENYMLMGDHKQSIYRWNGAYPDYIINLAEEPDVTTYELTKNFRNGYRILEYAKTIINLAGYEYQDHSQATRSTPGKIVDVEYSPHAIATTIARYGNFKDWFILTRTNGQIDDIIYYLKKNNVPCDTFKRAELDNRELNKKMKDDTVKVLTIHTAKGLEAKNVIVIGAKFYNTEEKCISYVAATRAKDLLVWTRMPSKKRIQTRISNWE